MTQSAINNTRRVRAQGRRPHLLCVQQKLWAVKPLVRAKEIPQVHATSKIISWVSLSQHSAKMPGLELLDLVNTSAHKAPCQILNCASDEVCIQKNGDYGCACGNITTSNSNIYDAIETCSGSTGSLSLSRCQLFEAGYSADVLHLNDPRCKGEIQHNRLVFKFDSNASMCGTTLENNGTHIIFKNNVRVTNGLISHTVGGLNIGISCVYQFIQNISMPMGIDATG
ncbi:pancreatic secretory granule membrane major glycoprotein GP2-like, partial [Tachysurus ichikawai]